MGPALLGLFAGRVFHRGYVDKEIRFLNKVGCIHFPIKGNGVDL